MWWSLGIAMVLSVAGGPQGVARPRPAMPAALAVHAALAAHAARAVEGSTWLPPILLAVPLELALLPFDKGGETITGMPPKRRSEPLLSMEGDESDAAPSAAVKLDLHRTRSENNLTCHSPVHGEQMAEGTTGALQECLSESMHDGEQVGAMPETSESTIALELVLRKELKGHDAAVTSLFVTRDQKRLLSSDRSGSIWSWAVD